MAKKPNFAAMNTERAGGDMAQNAPEVFSKVEQATSRKGQQGVASPAEAAQRASELRTRGRKGCKAMRINMAFTPENSEYIRIMASLYGLTMTEFTNRVIEAYRNENSEDFTRAKALKDEFDAKRKPTDDSQ